MSVNFCANTHQYFNELNQEYISVSKLIEKCLGSFDVDGVIDKIITIPTSIYYKKTKKEILAQWNTMTNAGTEAHEAIENYIKHNIISEDSDLKAIVEKFSKFKFGGRLFSEVMVWDDINLIAGTLDLIEKCDSNYIIWDIKTCRKMDNDKLHKYSIQLGFYKYLAGLHTNVPIEIGGILWVKDYFNKRAGAPIIKIEVDSCDNEIRDMINARKIELWKIWKKENNNECTMDKTQT